MESPNLGKSAMQKALDADNESSDFEVVQKHEDDLVDVGDQVSEKMQAHFPTPKVDLSNVGSELDDFNPDTLGGFDVDSISSHGQDDTFHTAFNASMTPSLPEDEFHAASPSSQVTSSANFISAEMGEMYAPKPSFDPADNFGAGGDDEFSPSYEESLETTVIPEIIPEPVKPKPVDVPSPIDFTEPEIPIRVESKPAPVEPKPVPKPVAVEPIPAPVEPKPKPAPIEQKKAAVKPIADSEINEPMELFCKMGLDAWFNPERLHPKVGDLVYWRDPKKSGIVFGSGLGILLSLSFFSLISVIAYLSLLSLTGTICYRIYKNVLQAVQKTSDGHPFKDILDLDLALPQDKVREVTDIAVAHVNAAILELRRLFLVEDLVDSIKFGVLLWCLTYLGAWFNGMTLIIIAFVAMFTLPKVYENNKSQIDQNLDIVRAKLADISAKVKAAVPIGKKPAAEEKKEQ